MKRVSEGGKLPKITVTDVDHERLSALATAILDREPDVAEQLLAEMDRAKVVPAAKIPPNVIAMNSWAEFADDTGQTRQVTLVYPHEADIAQGKVSVLTPIGAALIGVAQGQSISWTDRSESLHRLTVTSVEPMPHRENADEV